MLILNIAEFDKNLKVETSISKDDIVWLNAAEAPFVVYGATGTDPYMRMPDDVAKTVSPGVLALSKNTAGIRVRFRTNSPYIAIHCKWNHLGHMPHMPLSGSSGFDIYRYNNNNQIYAGTFMPSPSSHKGYESLKELYSNKITDYIINFPLYNCVDKLYIGISKNAEFETPAKYKFDLPVVFYGSSITQGGCAARPGNCYQNFLSRALDIDYVNLGFSGNGKAEDTMIDYLKNLNMSVFVSDYDHNAPTCEHLQNTHFKLYKEIREKNPDLPYIMLSKPDYHVGNAVDDERRNIVMESFIKAKHSGDKNVYFVDGASLFQADEWFACTVDGCHPTDLGFYRFAQALIPTFKTIFK